MINIHIPESRVHFFQQLGYILATLLLFVVLLVIAALVTRRHQRRGKPLARWESPLTAKCPGALL